MSSIAVSMKAPGGSAPESDQRHERAASDVERLFLSARPLPADAPVVTHLLEGCAACSDTANALWTRFASGRAAPPASEVPLELSGEWFDETWSRVVPGVHEARIPCSEERAEAKRLLPRLLDQPFERQMMLVSNSRRYSLWGLCELLLEAGWSLRFKEPGRTEAFARLALTVSAGLRPERYGSKRLHDLQARCWIALANGRRIHGDYAEATAAMERAQRLLEEGNGGLHERAHWLDIRSALLNSQRHFRAADYAVGGAIELYAELRDAQAIGSCLLRRASIAESLGEADRAIVLGRAGLELVDADREPSLLLAGWINLVGTLHAAGRYRDALAALGRARPAYIGSGDRTTFLRFQWLEGSIAASLGRDEQAEGCLRETRDGFLQLGIAHDAAIVSLDLASLLARQGRNAEVCRLAAEMIAIFESRESRTEAIAALILLRQAAERERVTEALLKRLRGSLSNARARG